MKLGRVLSVVASSCAFLLLITVSNSAVADQPVVTTVPGDANNPLIPHPVIAGRPVTLKGAVDEPSIGANWTWDPGDGSPVYNGVVGATHWAVWAEHTYAGDAGDVFIATLTVDNGIDPVGTATFDMELRADTVPNRANVAIAESMWLMHRQQIRFMGDAVAVEGLAESTIPMGRWLYTTDNSSISRSRSVSIQGATINVFEANGHRENGDATNPYTETVDRGLKYLFARLAAVSLDVQTVGSLDANPRNDDPDGDGNGLGITLDGRSLGVSPNDITTVDPPYQLGMVIDGIVASGTPNAVTTTGPTDVIGRTYGGVVQDLVDWYVMAQSDNASHGGWRYSAYNNNPGSHDNSTSGWAATGITAAEDLFGTIVPDWMKTRNINGLEFTDNESDVSDIDGLHGYASPNLIWGGTGATGAALVQMAMNGIEATTSPTPDERWVRTENYFRRHFNDAASGNNVKNYYYAMFNFAKAMRTAKPAAVTTIGTVPGAADGGIGCGPSPGCVANGPQPLDWYNDPVSGLAQTIVSYQTTTGPNIGAFSDRPGNSHGSNQDQHNQPWAAQILTRTLAQAGPIAVGEAAPNPSGEGFPIVFDHSRSFHQDPNRTLTTFEWDLNGNGIYNEAGIDESRTELVQDGSAGNEAVTATYDCGGNPLPCSHIINLRVTDDAVPPVTTSDVVVLDLTIPPHAPTADAGGPYQVCAGDQLTVDGSGSFDIDEGTNEADQDPPVPPLENDTITMYEWELDGVSPFDYGEAMGVTADVTYNTVGVQNIGLRVTDNSANSYPSASLVNLTGTDNTTVAVANCISTDLSVTATASETRYVVPVNDVRVFGIVTNNGPEDATDVILVANLADLVTIVDLVPDRMDVTCTATGIKVGTQDQYRCDVGDLAVGESVEIEVIFDAPAVGQGLFEFTVDIAGGPLVQLTDSDPNNNSFAVTIDFIEEIITIVRGIGTGALALAELAMLFGLVAIAVYFRRRRLASRKAGITSLGIVLLLAATFASAPAEAQGEDGSGFYAAASLGSVSSKISASRFGDALIDRGFDVSNVTLEDNETGWKVTVGYMFSENIGIQGSYVDLGQIDVEYTAAIRPDEIANLLDAGARELPGRGEGFLWDFIARFPLSDRVEIFGTIGMFMADPKSTQEVISGATGSAERQGVENDLAASLGIGIKAGERMTIRVAYERYDVDDNATDFPTATLVYRFGNTDD